MIDFEHVSKEYKKGGRLALEDINFHVDEAVSYTHLTLPTN